jgi:hypothetical protein
MPLQATSGAASYDAFGGGVPVEPNYIESVFSCFLYTGNNSTQTITNGIDLAGKGGLVWSKSRSAVGDHHLYDTARGLPKVLFTNGTNPSTTYTTGYDLSAFNTTGFSLGPDDYGTNTSGVTYASWTFREQPKFFDVVTWTGDGVSGRTVAHNLGSVPGCILLKITSGAGGWLVYHRSIGTNDFLILNDTGAAQNSPSWISVSSTTFTPAARNANGSEYVAYLFAHDAQGFGLTGTDNVISCGSFTTDGSGNATINLGYEPQWVLVKRTDTGGPNWLIFDNMRGLTVSGNCVSLAPNTSAADTVQSSVPRPNATGFTTESWSSSATYIYIAIRRGPMKVPTDATKVFAPVARAGTGTNPTVVTTGTNPDLLLSFPRTASPAAYGTVFWDKLRGVSQTLQSANINAEATTSGTVVLQSFLNTGFQTGADFINGYINYSGSTYVNYAATRAPGFFDEVCFTGNNTYGYKNHNLTVVPELIISKRRDASQDWLVWQPSSTYAGYLNLTDAFYNNGPSPATATQFTPILDQSSATYVVYLFASCPGVSKVGSYTGTGTTQTINCGFTAGSRFVMIKRTDSTGDWYVWDSARGIVAGNDPYLLLNSTAAEVTGTDYVDTAATGFEISSTAPAAINASGGTFIFLAIA